MWTSNLLVNKMLSCEPGERIIGGRKFGPMALKEKKNKEVFESGGEQKKTLTALTKKRRMFLCLFSVTVVIESSVMSSVTKETLCVIL